MIHVYSIMSHKLSAEQIADLNTDGIEKEIKYLPNELQQVFSNVDPNASLEDIETITEKIINFIESDNEIYKILIIQGHYGLTYRLVNFFKSKKYPLLYATTSRVVTETKQLDGSIKKESIFKHCRFTEY